MTGCQNYCDFRSSSLPYESAVVKEEIPCFDLWDRFHSEDDSYLQSESGRFDRWLDLNA